MSERRVCIEVARELARPSLLAKAVFDAVYRRACLNAEFGYPDKRLPVPEAMERPGWRAVQADPGADTWCMAVWDAPSASAYGASFASDAVDIPKVVRVEPTYDVEIQGGGPKMGVGWDAAERVLVMFISRGTEER